MTHAEDMELMRRVASRDDQAFNEVYARFAPMVRSIVVKILRCNHHTDDATNDTLFKVWKSAHTFNGQRASLNTWIGTIAKRTAVDLVRKSAWGLRPLSLDGLTDDGYEPFAKEEEGEHFTVSHKWECVLKEFDRASDRMKSVISARLRDCSIRETARLCNMPEGTVKSTQHAFSRYVKERAKRVRS